MGNTCYGDRKQQLPASGDHPTPRDTASKLSGDSEGAETEEEEEEEEDEESQQSDVSQTDQEGTMTKAELSDEIVTYLDTTYQNAGFLWSKTRMSVILQHRVVTKEANEAVFEESEPIMAVYIVQEGVVVREDGNLDEIGKNEGLCLAEVLESDNYPYTATAKEACTLFEFPISSFMCPPRSLYAAIIILENDMLKRFIENRDALVNVQRQQFAGGDVIDCTGIKSNQLLLIGDGEVEEVEERAATRTEKISLRRPQWIALKPGDTVKFSVQWNLKTVWMSEETMVDCFGIHTVQILWFKEFLKMMRGQKVFSEVDEADLLRIYKHTKFISTSQFQVVASANKSKCTRSYLVLRGALVMNNVIVAEAGEFYNLKVFTSSEYLVFGDDVYCNVDSVIASIPRRHLLKPLPAKVQKQMTMEAAALEFSKVQLFQGLPERFMNMLASVIEVHEFKNNETILEQGKPGKSLFVLLSGRAVSLIDNKREKTYIRYDYFGHNAFDYSPNVNSVIALGNVLCWELNMMRFGGFLEEVRTEFARRITTNVFALTPHHLTVRSVIENPMAAKTLLASTTVGGKEIYFVVVFYSAFASEVEKRTIETEIEILRKVSSPSLLFLYSEMRSRQFIVILYNFPDGIRLSDLMADRPEVLTDSLINFYAASLLVALESLHSHDILYLNLNPTNVIIEPSGFIKIVQYRGSQNMRALHTASITVTAYSAPEVRNGGKLGARSDLWSLGLVVLECYRIMLRLPEIQFNVSEISSLIIQMSSSVTTAALTVLKLLLLERDDEDMTVEHIMQQAWFNHTNWVHSTQVEVRRRKNKQALYQPSKKDKKNYEQPIDPVSLAEYVKTELGDYSDLVTK